MGLPGRIAVNGVMGVGFRLTIHIHVEQINLSKQMNEEMTRLRLIYQKTGNIRFTGTLDMQKIWERSCRRAGLAIAYSQGFHPQARIQQAAPLPLGMEGLLEIVDIWLQGDIDLSNFIERINKYLPMGINVNAVQKVDIHESSLQNRVNSVTYLIKNIQCISVNQLSEKINDLLNEPSIFIEKRGRQINVRELINSMKIQNFTDPNRIEIMMNLKHLPGKTGRPEDILQLIGIEPAKTTMIRERLHY